MRPDYTITINSGDYLVEPGTFREGSVRRELEVASLNESDFKSRPDIREFWQTSWTGGTQWEKPVYGPENRNTYYLGKNISTIDTPGSLQMGRKRAESSAPYTMNAMLAQQMGDKVVMYYCSPTEGRFVEWDPATDDWNTKSDNAGHNNISPMAITARGDVAYCLLRNGRLVEWDTTGSSVTVTDLSSSVDPENGTAIWIDETYLYTYDGDQIRRFDHTSSYTEDTTLFPINDGDGPDVYQPTAFTGYVEIFAGRRAIYTSEGIWYAKNVLEQGQVVCKVYRVDRDASGAYILTPYGTLPEGVVGVDIAYHLGSLLISSVPNLSVAIDNDQHQRCTIYHITGTSIGSIGSPLGGNSPDETPYRFLGSDGDYLWIGGAERVWLYDARNGSIHPMHTAASSSAGCYVTSASVTTTDGPARVFVHSFDGDHVTLNEGEWESTGWLESNYFDFDLPMESKSLDTIFLDLYDAGASDAFDAYISVDDGAWQLLAAFATDTLGHTEVSGYEGYKFRYKLEWANATAGSNVPIVRSLGFRATAGDMQKVLQFTINGEESTNIENGVQDPYQVYLNMATLRDNKGIVQVTHRLADAEGTEVTHTNLKVASVTASLDGKEGHYDVVLVEGG